MKFTLSEMKNVNIEKYDIIIRNGNIVTHEDIFKADIGIKDEKIKEINVEISKRKKAIKEIDASGLYVLPGLIDTHVHFNEPGRTEWEGFSTGSRSLAAGGVTTFFDMPLNSDPPLTTVEEFFKKKEHADKKSLIDYCLWGGFVPDNLEQLEELNKYGVIGFKGFMSNSGIDEFSNLNDDVLLEGMEVVSRNCSILSLHAENESICSRLAQSNIKNGKISIRDYVSSRPIISEGEAVMKAAAFAEVTNCKLHILHVSSGEAIKYVSEAKKRGVDITVETCPHYLTLNINDFEKLGGLGKCAPPLREQEHVDSLWRALENDEIDIIGSDHSPAPISMKELTNNQNIYDVWGGISGAQSTLAILLEEGYFKRGIPLETIVRILSFNPAKRFGLYPRKGAIELDSDADIVVIDLNKSYTLNEEDLLYRHKHSPYIGREFRGIVKQTILRGKTIWENGKIIENEGPGQIVTL